MTAASSKSKQRDYYDDYQSLFRGEDYVAFCEGTARETLLRHNASMFVITYRDDIDTLRNKLMADAFVICESVTVLNEFVFTERQKLKAIMFILDALCERYKTDLEKSLKPGYSFVERLTRIEKGVNENCELIKNHSLRQQQQLQYIIDNINGIPIKVNDLSIKKHNNKNNI